MSEPLAITINHPPEAVGEGALVLARARTVTVGMDGSLFVEGDGHGRLFRPGTWGSIEVRKSPERKG